MPNTYTENRDRWLDLSDVDYLGQFVKSWLAFNAWYRNSYAEHADRKIMDEFKWQPNAVRSKLVPHLTGTSEEAQQFRGHIGLLHHRLQGFHIFAGKNADKQQVTYENVYLRDNPPLAKHDQEQGYDFTVERIVNGQMRVEVKNRKGVVVINHTHPRHCFADIEALPAFDGLSTNLRGFLRGFYNQDTMKPKNYANLTAGAAPAIKCGSYDFRCAPDELFAGTVEVVYLMRCTLFHGELVPTRDAAACYEPAYHIVRKFLTSIT